MADLTTLDEQALLLLLRDGDESAFEEIYSRYWERLLAIGYFHTRSKESAEEIVGDVLLGLWQRRASLDIQSLGAYLGTAVKYAVFKAIDKQRRRVELLQSRPDVSTSQEEDSETQQKLEARFLAEFVAGVVQSLPDRTRLVYRYSREDNLSAGEIAGKMQLSVKAVEYHMTKAMKVIRDRIRRFNMFGF